MTNDRKQTHQPLLLRLLPFLRRLLLVVLKGDDEGRGDEPAVLDDDAFRPVCVCDTNT